MAHYLVTGGCGFIGSHLVDALCARGDRVRILDNLSSGTLRHKPPEAEFVAGDVADAATVAEAMRGADGCFHLAAVTSVDRSCSDWLGTHRTNLSGTIAVFEAARRGGCEPPAPVVFASSAAVYGDNPDMPLAEGTAVRPLSPYGADKLGCELHGAVAGRVHRLPNRGLRFFNVYGPRQDPRSCYSGVISIFCDRLKAGQALEVYGDGQQCRDFVYVGDVVRALLAAMERCSLPADIFNVCTGAATTVHDLAKILAEMVGVRPAISFAPARPGDIRASLGDPAKARRELGFYASTELIAGLTRTLRAT